MDSTAFNENLKFVRDLVSDNKRIAMHASLEDIYHEAVSQNPRFILELGVSKYGHSTKVLGKVAEMFGSDFISVDKDDFPNACNYPKWKFVRMDDIHFSKMLVTFCMDSGIVPLIDLLFIDTDELYDHVRQEIECYFSHLAEKCTVMFRCSNLQKRLYYQDGTETGLGWNNERGVIRALQEYLGQGWDEIREWQGIIGGWNIKHWPWGAGLTVMRRG
jgi:hypothetical protein